jgi:hypothetical protein
MLVMYFSIVRRSAAWASRERASASLIITTDYQPLGTDTQLELRGLTLESLFSIQVDLLRLSDLFEDILNDNSIVHSNVAAQVSESHFEGQENTHEGVSSIW